jgi:hypothetical protein
VKFTVVVSHAAPLIDALQLQPGCRPIALERHFAQTQLAGDSDVPSWQWPSR